MRPFLFLPSLPALVFALCALCPHADAAGQTRQWNFRVWLDQTPIGYHRFSLREQDAQRELTIEARFEVKILFISAYRYRHDATERWNGNCLDSLTAHTDDDGTQYLVEARRKPGQLSVTTLQSTHTVTGCAMSFAYWNPEILRQSHLLNAQTGEYEAVKVIELGDDTVAVRGTAIAAKHYRLTGPPQPIDLWYGADGDWLALESTVKGGRRLRYQRE